MGVFTLVPGEYVLGHYARAPSVNTAKDNRNWLSGENSLLLFYDDAVKSFYKNSIKWEKKKTVFPCDILPI